MLRGQRDGTEGHLRSVACYASPGMMIDPVEATFRARMRALAHKGGAVTKRRYANDSRHYRNIGRLGGQASVAARRARIAAELDAVKPGEAPIVERGSVPAEVPRMRTRSPMTFREILADKKRMGLRASDVSHRRQSVEDRLAEESFARLLVQIQQQNSEDWDEPFDELAHRW
jgi:general stress protein YciG